MHYDFGNTIRKALIKKNLTQKQLAKLLHISPQALNHYINNQRMPGVDCFLQLIELLDLKEIFYHSYYFNSEDVEQYLIRNIPHIQDEEKRILYLMVHYFLNHS